MMLHSPQIFKTSGVWFHMKHVKLGASAPVLFTGFMLGDGFQKYQTV